MCNPYAFYGQPQLWPRGYPLDRIKNEPECRAFRRAHPRPLILQASRAPHFAGNSKLASPSLVSSMHGWHEVNLPACRV